LRAFLRQFLAGRTKRTRAAGSDRRLLAAIMRVSAQKIPSGHLTESVHFRPDRYRRNPGPYMRSQPAKGMRAGTDRSHRGRFRCRKG
jgi:hypothetical protein